jgi:heme-degrading monooxygenase HmoA
MIARVWSAQTTDLQAPNYVEHLKTRVIPGVRTVDGFAGAMLLERAIPGAVEVIVITFWRSVDAIRGFAGDDLETAVVADEAAALLTQFDRRVRHYEVAVKDDV